MQKQLTITYGSGDMATVVAYPPDFAKWERAEKKSIREFSGIWDLLFIAYSALKREAGGKPMKPFEAWMETVVDIDTVDEDPKVISQEASAD